MKKLDNNEEIDEFIKEALLLNKMKHMNIVKFYGVVFDANQLSIKYLVFEFMNMGDLLKFLKSQKVNFIFITICKGIEFLFQYSTPALFKLININSNWFIY